MGVGLPEFREGRDKTRKILNFPMLGREIFTICPCLVRAAPILPF